MMMIMMSKLIFGDPGGLKLPDICLTDAEKPRKNLTQETRSDRGSNPGLLRERKRCYPLTTAVVGNTCNLKKNVVHYCTTDLHVVREISAINVTDNYLCYKESNSPYNFFLILIFNELFKFKTLDEWQH